MADNTSVNGISYEIKSSVQPAIDSMNKLMGATKGSSTSMNSLENNVKKISNATQKMAGTFNNVGRIIATKLGIGSLNQAVDTMGRLLGESTRQANALIENYNLFTVSMKNGTETTQEYAEALSRANQFQDDLNSAFGVAISNSMRYQGFFKNLAASLGLSNNASTLLSENLTKLTYDLASLYNTDFSTMYSKLQSGLVGQTKPLRSVGVDVTMQTLQPTLYSLDINKKVSELTQAQKVMLRYIEILRQTTSAQGDMARTIETPANQLRILKDQWQELLTWLGTFFIGAMGKILPYINGIVMSIKTMLRELSGLFGFNLADYQFIAETDLSVADYFDEATDSVEEFKAALAGFDEINLLGDNTSSTNPLAEDLYVTQQLEAAMASYDNKMSEVTTKATLLSDQFLRWLGFTTDGEGNIQKVGDGILGIAGQSGLFADNLVYAKGSLADIAVMVFNGVNEFFKNLTMIKNDVLKWLDEHTGYFDGFFDLLEIIGKLAFGMWLFYNPFALVAGGLVYLVLHYDDIKQWWQDLTPTDKLIGGIFALAAGIAAIMIALSGIAGAATGLSILAGLTSIGIGTFMLSNIGGFEDLFKTDGSNSINGGSAWGDDNQAIGFNPLGKSSYFDSSEIKLRANGGFPSSGEMFIAREAGAEMVGSIGGRTAVANNQDIVQAVSQGVAIAVSSVISNGNGQQVNIYLDDTLTGTALINTINRTTKNTGNTVLVG